MILLQVVTDSDKRNPAGPVAVSLAGLSGVAPSSIRVSDILKQVKPEDSLGKIAGALSAVGHTPSDKDLSALAKKGFQDSRWQAASPEVREQFVDQLARLANLAALIKEPTYTVATVSEYAIKEVKPGEAVSDLFNARRQAHRHANNP